MSGSWTIRDAERRDVPELLRIEEAQFPEPWSRSVMIDEVTNIETRRYRVALSDHQVVGYLGVMFVPGELHVNTIGVLPGYARRGVATALLDDAWRDAIERGLTRATLEVAVSNEAAQRLYARYGFAPVGVRRGYYERTHEDALVMWADVVDPLERRARDAEGHEPSDGRPSVR